MVIGRLVIPMKLHKKKMVMFVPKPGVWKLKDEETSRLFTHEMTARNDEDHHTHQHTHCQHNFHKHHTDGRQAQHTKGYDV